MDLFTHLPVQYISSKINATIVIENTQENKDTIEEVLCNMLGIRKTVGNVKIGPPMTVSEAVRYNEGFDAAMKIAKNVTIIECPDIEIDGKLVIKGPKRIREERGE